MADRTQLMNACKAGQTARQRRKTTGFPQTNPFKRGSLNHECFEAGYENDLRRWLDLFNGRSVATEGRLSAHETIEITRPGSGPEKGIFYKYMGNGLVQVRSRRFERTESVPREWVRKINRDGVAA